MNRRQFCYLSLGSGLALSGISSAQSTNFIKNSTVYIIHGYGATPQDHWFPWLNKKLQMQKVNVVSIPLPNSKQPDFTAWQQTLSQYIGMPDERCVFVAHSLGTISLLHYLSTLHPQKVGGIILVAGFGARIPGLSQIDNFNIDAYVDRTMIDMETIRAMTQQIYCIISKNDPIVAPQASHVLATQLNAHIVEISNGGHFLATDGFTELPEVWSAVEQCLM